LDYADGMNDGAKPEPAKTNTSRARRIKPLLKATWRWSKRVLLLLLILCLIGLPSYIVITNLRGAAAAGAIQQELADRDLLPVADDEEVADNGARFLVAATEVFEVPQELENGVPVVSFAEWPRLGEGFTPEQTRVLRAAVALQSPGYELVDRAADCDTFNYGFNIVFDTPRMTEIGSDLRRIARWQYVRLFEAQAHGEFARAFNEHVNTYALARSLNNDPNMFTVLILISLDSMAMAHTEDLLSRQEIDIDQIEQIRSILKEAGPDPYMKYARGQVRQVAWMSLEPRFSSVWKQFEAYRWAYEMGNIWDQDEDKLAVFRSETLQTSWADRAARIAADLWIGLCPGRIQVTAERELSHVFDFLDRLEAAGDDANALWAIVENPVDSETESGWAPTRAALQMGVRMHTVARGNRLVADAALRVERFRVIHGRWPQNLSNLQGGRPTGVFGTAMKLLRFADGVMIYDPELVKRWREQDENAEHYDPQVKVADIEDRYSSFRLLDPEHRMSEPTVTEVFAEEQGDSEQALKDLEHALKELFEAIESVERERKDK